MRKSVAKSVLAESVIVALGGAILAFAANEVSPRGLVLARNYFPGSSQKRLGATLVSTQPPPGAGLSQVIPPAPTEVLAARLRAIGLQVVDSNQMTQLFRDPRYEQEQVVFVDARDDRHYQEGHIPGAHQFDHYRPENYIATVLLACQLAQKIVVYCTGGDCEDSEFAAIFLRDAGIPKEKLFVYAGGINEWNTNGLPVEVGGRKSGNFRPAKP